MKVSMRNEFIERIVLKNSRGNDVFLNVVIKNSSDVLIFVHGFDSNKSGSTFRYLADKLDVSIVSFDLPMHGESSEELLLFNCIDDLFIVDQYVRGRFNCPVSLFGSSFGSFVILNFLKRNPDLFYKGVFLKSSAIKMDKVFRDVLIEESMDSFKNRGYTVKNRNKKMIIPYAFYEELVSNQINIDDFSNRDLYLFHGVNDNTALIDDLSDFNGSNVHVMKLSSSHVFDDDSLSSVVDRMHTVLR